MPYFLKNSIVIASIVKAVRLFLGIYRQSRIKYILDKILLCYNQSRTKALIGRYVSKNPYFLNSVFYRITRKAVEGIDFVADIIHDFIVKLADNTMSKKFIVEIKDFPLNKKLMLLGLFVIAMGCGFLTSSVFIKSGEPTTLIVSWFLMFTSLIFYMSGKFFIIFKNSLIYKFIKYLFN